MSTDADVLVAGETLIDFLPERPGPLSSVEGFDRRPGGAPANVAVALARLERTPLFWTRVGDDPFGGFLHETLTDYGLSERYVETDSEAKTTLAFVTHDETGDRTFTFYRENTADTRMQPETVDDETLSSLEWVHTGGVALSSGSSRAATIDLCERAATQGCTVSFDPNARPELWPDEETFARVVGEALEYVDVLKATVEELRMLGFGGETPAAVAREVLAGNPHTVFVTRGSEGAVAVASVDAPWGPSPEGGDGTETGPRQADHSGFDVEVVDTTGAGDAFVAGTVAALTDGHGLEETLTFASAVAARATTAAGAMTALPDREGVEEVLTSASESKSGTF
ncbi:carbohydrate kinase [Halobacteria archaeon AArc-m2/3/4]|uniref:Carbohydrate kinase n=1 Tax=Natronoglomus mannanivorans TaxID=2979990 RepID=A0ABT2Q8G9_9EURY|nr:carbohydrate kinase [Halobacteria archaeon AArc-m2/3/4]